MRKNNFFLFGLLFLILIVSFEGCETKRDLKEINAEATIFPDYKNIYLPPNIAPLNFQVMDTAEKYYVNIYSTKGRGISITSGNASIKIPVHKWKRLLGENKGKKLFIDIHLQKKNQWQKYKTITNFIAGEEIDGYLVYRLIEPGYETWNVMGIYQRNLESFDEEPVMLNRLSDGNCMNCHSFCRNDNNTMLFHMRAAHAGTVILKGGKIEKVDTKTDSTLSAGVYPSWHPQGRYIAFSVNRIVQSFHALPGRKIEVVDTLSDLMVYDTERKQVIGSKAISAPDRYETFPCWSPDGRYLYYCSAPMQSYKDFMNVKYDLLRTSFDPVHVKFGKTDTLIAASRDGYSISFPRVSPEGKSLVFCKTAYGNFTIWHDDSDLYNLDLETGSISQPGINSGKAESYHTFSSNGRWMVFSSRRMDGLYTRPFFTYIDSAGEMHKPFLLPQKNPGFYNDFMKSFNVPELVKSKVELNPRKLRRTVAAKPVKTTFVRAVE